jgi:hypothetical protein
LVAFVLTASVTNGLVTFAVTSSFAQSIILCAVSGGITALGGVVVAMVGTREARRNRDAVEEAKQLNRQNRKVLDDIAAAQNVARRRTDKIDLENEAPPTGGHKRRKDDV